MSIREPEENQMEKKMENELETGMHRDVKGLGTQP